MLTMSTWSLEPSVKRHAKRHKLAQSNAHPGELYRALVDTAIILIARTPQWNFSVKQVARKAGVSKNTPFAYFPSKHELIEAVAAYGFARLREVMITSQLETKNAIEALDAIGVAYLIFGYENPGLYRLMLKRTTTKVAPTSRVTLEAERSQEVLYNTLKHGARDGTLNIGSGDSLESAALAAWSLMHGLTLLVIDGVATESITMSVGPTTIGRSISAILLNGLRHQILGNQDGCAYLAPAQGQYR
jgi:AcrR family transcriptional regulator